MQGNKYCVNDIILVGFKDELPQFGKINGIIMMMSHMFFALNLFVTKGADRHHNSFVVQKSAQFLLKHVTEDSVWMGKQHSLQTHQLHSCIPGTFHIVTKYFLISNLFLMDYNYLSLCIISNFIFHNNKLFRYFYISSALY